MSKNLQFWEPIVGKAWYLNNTELFDSKYMSDVMGFLMQDYSKSNVVPLQSDIFKAFKMTPYDEVKVIILGEDVYSTSSNGFPDATGLAFANRSDVINIDKSLRSIFSAIENTCYDGLNIDTDITLESWAKQGVLLLNTSLTQNIYRKQVHKGMWKPFTEQILKGLSQNKNGLHFCFWGKEVKYFEPIVNGLFHYKYEGDYPSGKRTKMGEDWKCTHFQDINNNIIGQNGKESIIVW